MRWIEWIINHAFIVTLATVLVALAGVFAWIHLPIDAFPDVTNTQVMILTQIEGFAAEDIEQRVSYPIEQAMRGLPKITQVRSLSKAGLSQVVIIFEDGVDTYWTRQLVFERLETARADLPPGAEPELGPISTGLGEIFQYTLESEAHDAMQLRSIQDWLVAPMLKPIPGVNEVNSFGGFVKQYHVILDPEKLLAVNLTARDVVEAIERNNANAGGGVVVQDWEQLYLRGIGLLSGMPDLERIVLKASDSAPVFLRDVAEITIGSETRQGAVTRDGKGEVVAGMIIMLKGENSKDVVSRVKTTIEKIGQTLPDGVRINTFYDRTSLIEACIDTVVHALLEGGILVILILFLFLAEWRTAMIVVLSLPLTFLASFIVMGRIGLSSNLMSLGGLAFSVGMVVDASIVIVENIRRHLAEKGPDANRRQVVSAALHEVTRPVAFSVIIIAVILVPLFTLQGIEGKMFAPLALTMLIALVISLIVAVTAMPALSQLLLTSAPEREFRIVRRIHESYMRLLERALANPRRTLIVSILFLVVSCGFIPLIGTEFMPPLDEGAIAINAVRLPNASLEGSVTVSGMLEKRILKYPEVETVVSKTGRAEISEDPMGPEQTDLFIMLKPRREWTTGRNKNELVEAIQKDLATIAGLRMSFSQPIALRVNELISGVKSDLAVKIFGPDLAVLKESADRIASVIGSVDGAEDVKVEQISGIMQLDVVIDRDAIARFGIDIQTLNETLETAVAGTDATTVIEGDQRIAVVVRYPDAYRTHVESIKGLLIPAPGGRVVPLSQLARIETVEAPAQISRENGMRRVVVETNVRGRDLGGFVRDVQSAIESQIKVLPSGYFVEYGGQFENQQRAMRQLSIVVPIALLLIFVLLYAALGSAPLSFIVLANLPFALIGGVIWIVLFRMPLSVSAAVAFIVLLGVAVQNGVVLIAFFHRLQSTGTGFAETIREGCRLRFRPLLMTALTSFIGHFPMLYATGSGADIQKPLAVVVMGGLITCTFLTLIVLPVIYQLVFDPDRKTRKMDVKRVQILAVLILTMMVTGGSSALSADHQTILDQSTITLPDAIERIMRDHPDLESAKLLLNAEIALADDAGTFPNPDISIEIENIAEGTVSRENGDKQVNAGVLQSIELGGKRARRIEAAEMAIRGARFAHDRVTMTMRSEIMTGFIDAVEAQDMETLKGELLRISEAFHKAARSRVDAGKAPPIEVSRASVELDLARIEAENARRLFTSAAGRFALLLGLDDSERLHFDSQIGLTIQIPPLEELLKRLDSMPDLIKVDVERGIAETELAVKRSLRYPDLEFILEANGIDGDREERRYTAGVSIPIPLFTRGTGAVRAADARSAAVRAQRESIRRRMISELTSIWEETMATTRRVATIQERILPDMHEMLSAVQSGYLQGKFDYLDILSAQREFFAIREQLIESEAESRRMVVRMYQLTAMDGLLGNPIKGDQE